MNLKQTTEFCLSLLEQLHQTFPGSFYVERTPNLLRKLQLSENLFIQIAKNPNDLPVYIEPVRNSKVLFEFDISRIIQTVDCLFSWYLPIPKNPVNKRILDEFGLVCDIIPPRIYKIMCDQQKEVKNNEKHGLTKSGYEFIRGNEIEKLQIRFIALIVFILGFYSGKFNKVNSRLIKDITILSL